jgi:hypothetical protein
VWDRKQFHKDPAPPTMKKKEELANTGENIGENSIFVFLQNFVKMQEIKIKREYCIISENKSARLPKKFKFITFGL